MKEIIEEINQLKKEKNAVILAHYYVDGAIQDIADYLGDSYYLSKIALTVHKMLSSLRELNLWVKVLSY